MPCLTETPFHRRVDVKDTCLVLLFFDQLHGSHIVEEHYIEFSGALFRRYAMQIYGAGLFNSWRSLHIFNYSDQIERSTSTAWGRDSCNKVGKYKSGEIPFGRQNLKLKIGVMGSATGTLSKTHKKIAYELGLAIAQSDCVTITGACPGLPLESAKGAHEAGGIVIGISPALSEWEHVSKYGSPLKYHDVLIFTEVVLWVERL